MPKHDDEDLPALNTVFHGQVESVQKYGVFVSRPGFKRHGLVHVSQMSSSRVEDPAEMLSKGEQVWCKVISVEKETSKFGLSMKLCNQTTGQDLDPNNVTQGMDEKKRRQFFKGSKPPIELGAVYDTKCRVCGGHGHLAMECFTGKGGKQYDLVPDLEDMVHSEPEAPPPAPAQEGHSHKKKKKKEKKMKKDRKKKKKRHASSSDSSESERESRRDTQKKRKRRRSSSSDSVERERHRKHNKSSHKHRS